MSEQSPYEKLGVTEDASFEEIQEAKNRLTQKYREDNKLTQSIEAAYDSIIMERLRMRQEGRIKVPERIRFPDKEKMPEVKSSFNPVAVDNSPQWLQGLIDTPSKEDILWSAGVFSALSALVVLTSAANPSVVSLAMALGFGGSMYLLNRKENRLGRSFLLTFIGLLVGVGLGTVLAGMMETTLTSIGVQSAPFATLVTFFIFWLISSFLR